MNFSDFSLRSELLETLADIGFDSPTPIQEQTIVPALNGRDILGIAQTGTGKTGAFLLPLINLMADGRSRARMPRCVILEPTRELAGQVEEACIQFCKKLKLETALLIGGVSAKAQEDKINRGVDILIATPGRFIDHFERGKLLLSDIKYLVIDEADRMLDMGFVPDIEKICQITPFTKQTLLFSATMPKDIAEIAEKFMSSPTRVEVSRQSSTGENIAQHKIFIHEKNKRELLRAILKHKNHNSDNTIVFCNSKKQVGVLNNSLLRHGFSCAALHGDIPQSVRINVLEQFKNKSLQILVASDVAARGIDVPHVGRVINFDVPSHPEDYVHRIGRTGRGGRQGETFMFVNAKSETDKKKLNNIETLIKSEIPLVETSAFDYEAHEDEQAQATKTPVSDASRKVADNPKHSAKERGFKPQRVNVKEKPYGRNSSRGADHPDVLTLEYDPKSFNDCREIPQFLLTPIPKIQKQA